MLSEVMSTWAGKADVFEATVADAERAVEMGEADAPSVRAGPVGGRPRMIDVMGLEVTDPTCERIPVETTLDDPLTVCKDFKKFLHDILDDSVNNLYKIVYELKLQSIKY